MSFIAARSGLMRGPVGAARGARRTRRCKAANSDAHRQMYSGWAGLPIRISRWSSEADLRCVPPGGGAAVPLLTAEKGRLRSGCWGGMKGSPAPPPTFPGGVRQRMRQSRTYPVISVNKSLMQAIRLLMHSKMAAKLCCHGRVEEMTFHGWLVSSRPKGSSLVIGER